jgi:hypothetical protein
MRETDMFQVGQHLFAYAIGESEKLRHQFFFRFGPRCGTFLIRSHLLLDIPVLQFYGFHRHLVKKRYRFKKQHGDGPAFFILARSGAFVYREEILIDNDVGALNRAWP